MILNENSLQFDFKNAIAAFKFDEQDQSSKFYHGLSHCMKAVDFIVEYPAYYLYIEIKDPPSLSHYSTVSTYAVMDTAVDIRMKNTHISGIRIFWKGMSHELHN